MEFTKIELNLFRQWYNAVQDSNPQYLEEPDHALARKVLTELGMTPRAPDRAPLKAASRK